jgi:hypothetical protein
MRVEKWEFAWELRSESLHESWEVRVCMRVEKREFAWELMRIEKGEFSWKLRSESLHESWEARVCTRVYESWEARVCWELRSESLHESWWELRSESLHESWEARVCMRVQLEARVCMRVFSTLMPRLNENKSWTGYYRAIAITNIIKIWISSKSIRGDDSQLSSSFWRHFGFSCSDNLYGAG